MRLESVRCSLISAIVCVIVAASYIFFFCLVSAIRGLKVKKELYKNTLNIFII